MSSSSSRLAFAGIGVLAIIGAIVGVFIWLWGAQFATASWIFLLQSWPFWVTLIVFGGIVLWGALSDSLTGFWMAGIAGLLGLVMLIAGPWLYNWQRMNTVSQSVEIVDEPLADYRDRAPYDVAVATSTRSLGDTTGTHSGKVKALPQVGDHGIYSSSVIRRGFAQGYESTQQLDVPIFGQTSSNDVSFCDFEEDARHRLGGAWPVNDLNRIIHWNTPLSTKFDTADAFIVCEDDVPMVHVPLVSYEGFMAIPSPGGVAVYNGHTGDLDIVDDYSELAEKGYPVYPSSVATIQRESTQRSGTIWDTLFNRAGYEDTTIDADDPNGVNRAEFSLTRVDGDATDYVTPLTSRGDSSSIIAVGTVRNDADITKGELSPYIIHDFPDGEHRQANSAVAATIRGDVLDGYMAQGLTVFEIVPSADGAWSASIGNDQSVKYRATIAADGRITLLDQNGKEIGASGGTPADGEVTEPGDDGSMVTNKPVNEMSADELKQLSDEIVNELIRRAEQSQQ